MKSLKKRLSLAIKERIYRHYRIPFSRYGLEPSLIEFLKPTKPMAFVDAGASAGDFAKAIAAQYDIRRAFLIEPQPERCRQLKLQFSDDPMVSIHTCALSDNESTRDIDVLNWDYASSILPVRRDIKTVTSVLDLRVREKITCRTTTLDTLMQEADYWDAIDLFKLDIQGAELSALRGARKTLPRVSFILTEVSFQPLYEGSALFTDVFDYLYAFGFRLLSLSEGFRGSDAELLQADALFAQ